MFTQIMTVLKNLKKNKEKNVSNLIKLSCCSDSIQGGCFTAVCRHDCPITSPDIRSENQSEQIHRKKNICRLSLCNFITNHHFAVSFGSHLKGKKT